jgi:hypothetical protein
MPPTLPDLPEAFVPSWLSDTVTRPHANVATSTTRPQFEILPIDAVELDAVGLLPRSITGLPEDLWGTSERRSRAALPCATRHGASRRLSLTEMLALAELVPPWRGRAEGGAVPRPARHASGARRARPGAGADGTRGAHRSAGLPPLLRCEPPDRPWRPRLPRDGCQPRHRADLSGAHLLPCAGRRLARGGAVLRHRARRSGGSTRWRPT